jgi:hypothetical protein
MITKLVPIIQLEIIYRPRSSIYFVALADRVADITWAPLQKSYIEASFFPTLYAADGGVLIRYVGMSNPYVVFTLKSEKVFKVS